MAQKVVALMTGVRDATCVWGGHLGGIEALFGGILGCNFFYHKLGTELWSKVNVNFICFMNLQMPSTLREDIW